MLMAQMFLIPVRVASLCVVVTQVALKAVFFGSNNLNKINLNIIIVISEIIVKMRVKINSSILVVLVVCISILIEGVAP